ncbi:unnamed protein product [Sphenostylis stenocarpa]|uniref:Uncharacterized protein n=1 Tax=Sphenostylis stenocarpa TaxID=92480 RepID=A0AA86VE88_9FABA|nr:unnamed protein product [Sphenostylis stenocarpa]
MVLDIEYEETERQKIPLNDKEKLSWWLGKGMNFQYVSGRKKIIDTNSSQIRKKDHAMQCTSCSKASPIRRKLIAERGPRKRNVIHKEKLGTA